MAVALAGLVWHILACVESPMSFSPNGKDLAFTTMEPYTLALSRDDDKGLARAGPHDYRVMILVGGKDLQLVEESPDYILTAPGYSPDGKHLCYLKIPLLTPEGREALLKAIENANGHRLPPSVVPVGWATTQSAASATAPASQPADVVRDLTLPPAPDDGDTPGRVTDAPIIPATLVIRDVQTNKVTGCYRVALPAPQLDHLEETMGALYDMTHPQYSPDGKWVYFCAGYALIAVNLAEPEERLLAAPVMQAQLSPDGQWFAIRLPKAIGFVQFDGQARMYPSMGSESGGIAWLDKETAVFRQKTKEPGETAVEKVEFLHINGTLARSLALSLQREPSDIDGSGQFAIAPDGRHMVVADGEYVFFTDEDGKSVGHYQDKELPMYDPVFAPDSSRVAFKRFSKVDSDTVGHLRVAEIVFFTPEGKELSSVKVPPIKPTATRPAGQPATAPAGG
jgi:hypothetical protein